MGGGDAQARSLALNASDGSCLRGALRIVDIDPVIRTAKALRDCDPFPGILVTSAQEVPRDSRHSGNMNGGDLSGAGSLTQVAWDAHPVIRWLMTDGRRIVGAGVMADPLGEFMLKGVGAKQRLFAVPE